MTYTIKITPTALFDMKSQIGYYNDQQKGLGSRFSAVVEDAVAKIKKAPFSSSLAYDDVRYKVVQKFPFLILYKIEDNLILILRVFNSHRSPVS
jgi:hypothetical protein